MERRVSEGERQERHRESESVVPDIFRHPRRDEEGAESHRQQDLRDGEWAQEGRNRLRVRPRHFASDLRFLHNLPVLADDTKRRLRERHISPTDRLIP